MIEPNRVLALWWTRIIFLAALSTPSGELVFETLGINSLWFFLPLLLLLLLVLFYFYLRSRSLELKLSKQSVTYTVGVFFRRRITFKTEHILASTRLSTPLSKKLGLCNLYVCCEGANFILFPLSEKTAGTLEATLSSPELPSAEKEFSP